MDEELAVVPQQQQNPDLLMVGVSTCNMETPLRIKNKNYFTFIFNGIFLVYFIYFCFEIYFNISSYFHKPSSS